MKPTLTLARASRRILHYTTSQFVLFLAGVGLLYVSLLFLLNSSLSSALIERAFNQNFRGSIGWDRLHFGPLPWELDIVGLEIREPGGQPVILADALQIERLDLANIIAGSVHVDGLRIINPKIRLRQVPNDDQSSKDLNATVINIAQVFEPLVPSPPDPNAEMDVIIRDIRIKNADLVYASKDVQIESTALSLMSVDFRLGISPSGDDMIIDMRSMESEALTVKVPRVPQQADLLSWALTDLQLRGFHWSRDRFTLQSLQGLLAGDGVRVSNFMMELGTEPGPVMTIDAELNSKDVRHHVEQFGLVDTYGPADVKLKGTGAVKAFTGTLSLVSPSLSVEGYATTQTSIKTELREGRYLELSPSSVGIWGGTTKIEGTLDLLTGQGDVSLSAESLTLNSINGLTRKVRYGLNEGTITTKLQIHTEHLFASERQVSVEGTMSLARTNPAMPLARRLSLRLKGAYEGTRLSFETLNANSSDESFNLGGWFDHASKTMQANGSIRIGEIAPLMQLWSVPLSGQVNVRFQADGKVANPNVSVSLTDTELSYGALKQVGVTGDARLSNRQLSVKNLRLMAKKAGVAIVGTMDLRPKDPKLKMSLITENLELKLLELPHSLSGRASLEIDLSGTVKQPKGSVRGRIRNLCFTIRKNAKPICIDGIQTRSEVSRDLFALESFVLRDRRWGMINAFGKGSIKKESFSGTVDVVDFPLTMIDQVLEKPLRLSGTLDADLSIGGTLTHPLGGGKIEIQEFEYGRYQLGDVTVLVLANELKSTVQLLMLNGQRLVVQVPFDTADPPTAELRLKGFVPKDWLPQLKDVPLDAKLSGSVNAQFKNSDFELASADLSLSEIECAYELDGFRVHLRPKGDVAASWRDGGIVVQRLQLDVLTENILEGDSSERIQTMTIGVTGGVPGLKHYALQYEGTISMAGVRPFIKGTFSRAEGEGAFSGQLTGALDAPKPAMKLKIASALLTPRSAVVGTQIELQDPLNLQLTATSETAEPGNWTIRRDTDVSETPTRILRDESVFQLSELSIVFERFRPRRVTVGGSVFDLSLRVPGILSATVNAPNLEVEWSNAGTSRLVTAPELRVSGDLEVQNGVYVKDITGVNEINEGVRNRLIGRSVTQTVNAADRFPILKRLKLDLSVSGDGDFFVRNRITVFSLDMEIRIALEKITGFLYPAAGDSPEDQLRILGDVTILPDSKLIYARRDFDVNRGIIDFGKGQFMDASLEASRTFTLRSNRSSGVTSTQFDRGGGDVRLEEVNLTARIQQSSLEAAPKISMNLSSNSGASKFDVAMLVLTGSYPEDASSAASAQPATQVLLAPLLNLVERPLEDTLNIDLSLTPATAGSLFIDIDKMLSRRLRLYSRVFVGDGDDTNPQQFGLEYQINNTMIGEFTSEKTTNYLSTAGRFRLKLELD